MNRYFAITMCYAEMFFVLVNGSWHTVDGLPFGDTLKLADIACASEARRIMNAISPCVPNVSLVEVLQR